MGLFPDLAVSHISFPHAVMTTYTAGIRRQCISFDFAIQIPDTKRKSLTRNKKRLANKPHDYSNLTLYKAPLLIENRKAI